ncbi:MAG: TPM domain-containing protein [Acetobacter orientalis]|uniref:TPM domain-containing protein n=1 Tax=Acetobacter orientalis TaxID=146474 RepID=UPI0039E8F024
MGCYRVWWRALAKYIGLTVGALWLIGGSLGYAQAPYPPKLQNWVTDPQHVLSDAELIALTQRLQKLSQTLPGAPQIVIDLPAQVADIASYANDVFHTTGLGRKGDDNGVLIVLAIAQRQARIEVGYGFEGILTDLQSSDILRANRPALQAGHYATALNGIVSAVADLLAQAPDGGPTLAADAEQKDALEGVVGVIVAVLCLVVLPYYLMHRACRQVLQKPSYNAPTTQASGPGWEFWLNFLLNILAIFLQTRGGGSGRSGGGFRSGGGDSGGGGAQDSW